MAKTFGKTPKNVAPKVHQQYKPIKRMADIQMEH
jgi:hypothetical protein